MRLSRWEMRHFQPRDGETTGGIRPDPIYPVAGIDLYYVIDETAATHDIFADEFSSPDDWEDWMDDHRHQTGGNANILGEFVYLSFIDSWTHTSLATTGGLAWRCGASVAVDTKYTQANSHGDAAALNDWLARTAAHELAHLIHADDEPASLGSIYLMTPLSHPDNSKTITFSNTTRGKLNLATKLSTD